MTTTAYSLVLLVYFVNMARSPQAGLDTSDRQIEGEVTFQTFATVIKLIWMFAFSIPFFLQPAEWFGEATAIVLGVLLFFLGLWTRMTAIRTLGRFFTYELTIKEGHQFIRSGIYRYLRHPSYTGSLLQVAGLMIVARSLPGFLLCMLTGALLFAIRIYREEKVLIHEFGEDYREYARRTWRVIPWLA